jgi:hypothetical protein
VVANNSLPAQNGALWYGPRRRYPWLAFGWNAEQKWGEIQLRNDIFDQQLSFLRTNKLAPIEVFATTYGGQTWTDAWFLEQMPWILALSLQFPIGNLNRIESLKHIQEINMSQDIECEFDVSALGSLRRIQCNGKFSPKGLFDLGGLRSVDLRCYNPTNGSMIEFAKLQNLSNLTLCFTNILNFDGLESCRALQTITISYAPKLRDWAAIRALLPNIKGVEFESVKNLDIEGLLSAMEGVEAVRITNCGAIQSLGFVKNLPLLSKLWFVGTTVADGRIQFLKEHPALRDVNFNDKKHYDAKRSLFEGVT